MRSAEQTVKPEAICTRPADVVDPEVALQSVAEFQAVNAEATQSVNEQLADGLPLDPAAAAATRSFAEQSDDCGGYVSIAASPRAGGTLSIPDASKGRPPALAMSGGDSSALIGCSAHCQSRQCQVTARVH